MIVFAQNYRGFRQVEIDLSKVNLLVGDNSCGKSSLIYLAETIARTDLTEVPRFDVEFAVDEYDYFSPYTDYNDVVFGYKKVADGNFAKLITVKRVTDSSPELVSCTYFHKSKFISFKITEGNYFRREGAVGSYATDNLVRIHNDDSKYKRVNKEPPISIGNPAMLLVSTKGRDGNEERDFFSKAIDSVFDSPRVISPLRALPEKYYNSRRRVNAHGKHFASMWYDFSGVTTENMFAEVENFGAESGLFDKIIVGKIAPQLEDSPLIVTIVRAEKEFLLNQVGIGVSQVVPVLIDTIYSMRFGNPPILMQQPELHLHPIAQAALGTYLAKCSHNGLRPVIETHSSYLIDRIRADIRDFSERNELSFEAEIIFCEKTNSGNSATHIAIDKDGQLVNPPESYHSFFVEELVRTMI